jgi:RimJ/RimL family protein N-acetyltransferase
VFLAIIRRADARHVGNLRIGAIDRHHRSATVALVIGDKTAWGQGIGSDAIATASTYAFTTLGLEKLTARVYASNTGSIRAFEKAGWRHEGRQRRQFQTEAGRDDGVWLGIECPPA